MRLVARTGFSENFTDDSANAVDYPAHRRWLMKEVFHIYARRDSTIDGIDIQVRIIIV